MPFPLGGSPVSASIEVFSSPLLADNSPLMVDVDVVRTMKVFPAHFGLHFAKHRTVDVEIRPAIAVYEYAVHGLQLDLDATVIHTFTGIGGTRYIPSFPQWDRQETSYPFAF